MSKYQSWIEHLIETRGDGILSYFQLVLDYPLEEWLDHQERQCAVGGNDERWQRLGSAVAAARAALSAGDPQGIARAFSELGGAIEGMGTPVTSNLVTDLQLRSAAFKRKLPLLRKQAVYEACREFVQGQAAQIWAADAQSEYRVIDVAVPLSESLNAMLLQRNLPISTITPKTVRDWVSKSAPAYAKKPGRPKK